MKNYGFTALNQRLIEDADKHLQDAIFYIENGFLPSWAEEHRTNPDRGIEAYITPLRWTQYQDGIITRDKAVGLAQKRAERQLEKDAKKRLARLETVESALDIDYINIYVNWARSATWGYNPHAEVITNKGVYYGSASGWGYDKESAAVAQALNQCNSILKSLYQLKEDGLNNGLTDFDDASCTGVNNRNICGYGAGYGVLPAFEGGVGMSCFISILEKCGYKLINESHLKKSDCYCFWLTNK